MRLGIESGALVEGLVDLELALVEVRSGNCLEPWQAREAIRHFESALPA
jgi:hypothetical protein